MFFFWFVEIIPVQIISNFYKVENTHVGLYGFVFVGVFFFLLRDILKKYAHVVVFLRKFWNSYRKYINIFLKNANLDIVVSGSSSAKSRAEFCLLGTIPTRMTVLPQHSARAGWDDGRINNCMCLWYFYRRIQINTVLPDLYLIWIYLKIV